MARYEGALAERIGLIEVVDRLLDKGVVLAGDVTDTLEQLHARRADAIGPDPKVHVATLELILAHCAQHPTVYLPSHDPDSARRLGEGIIVS